MRCAMRISQYPLQEHNERRSDAPAMPAKHSGPFRKRLPSESAPTRCSAPQALNPLTHSNQGDISCMVSTKLVPYLLASMKGTGKNLFHRLQTPQWHMGLSPKLPHFRPGRNRCTSRGSNTSSYRGSTRPPTQQNVLCRCQALAQLAKDPATGLSRKTGR